MADSAVPIQVRTSRLIQLAAQSHACGLTVDRRVVCWGCPYAASGAACGSTEPANTPHEVPLLPPMAKVTTGSNYACGLSREGEVYCWGSNEYCAIGDYGQYAWPRKIEFPPLE
jgi:alpha-tubulin suppressor-like RCC1 family protein